MRTRSSRATTLTLRRGRIAPVALTVALVVGGCSCDGCDAGPLDPTPKISEVWLAQTHVQPIGGQPELAFAEDALNRHQGRTDLAMLELVGGRDALLKVDFVSGAGVPAPSLHARVLDATGAEAWAADLAGPSSLPRSLPAAPGRVRHDLATSFAVIVPGVHVRPGMAIELNFEADGLPVSELYPVDVGAPTVLPVFMFDFDFFGTRGTRILSDAVVDEVGRKLPVQRFAVQRIDTPFSRATFLPQTQTVNGVDYTTPHLRATSFEDWAAQAEAATGVPWQARNERSVDHSQVLLGAMSDAGGLLYIAAFHGNFVDGTTGNFKGRGGSNMRSSSTSSNVLNARNVFVHEFSHNLDLYHWHEQTNGDYPYRDAMFGIGAEGANGVHCGPIWRYREPAYGDGPLGAFVEPSLPATGGGLRYRRVISTSGSRDDIANEFGELVGTFSDWDVRVAQEWLEQQLRVFNPDLGAWARWDSGTAGYTRTVAGTFGVDLPLDPVPVEVFTVLVAASQITLGANLVYDPVGPYESYLLRRFDPNDAVDMAAVAGLPGYCPTEGCDYAIRVTRGGVTATYLLRIADAVGAAPTDDAAVRHGAINLPVSEGALERIELLATPDAQLAGAPANPVVLFTWLP